MTVAFLVAVTVLEQTVAAEGGKSNSLRSDLSSQSHLVRHYGTREGLPSNWVNDVIQASDGFIWIGTDNGLVRYDGSDFKLITPESTQQSPRSNIHVLCEDRDGVLWIGTSAGLARYAPGFPSQLEYLPNISGKSVFEIYEDREGKIWVGTEAETYVGTNASGFRVQDQVPTNVRAICESRDGALWIGSHLGLFRRHGDQIEQLTHERLPKKTSPGSGIPQTRVNTITESESGDLWIGTNRALLHFRDGQFTARGRELGSQQIYDVRQTRDGSLYVAARFGLFRAVGESKFEEKSNTVSAFCVMEDRDGDLWVGHVDNRGLRRFRNRHARVVWSESPVRCLFEAFESDLWFGANNGLHRIRDGQIETYGVDEGLPNPRVQTIARSSGESLWIATARGLVKWSGTELIAAPTPKALDEMNVSVVLEDSSGTLWLALARGGGFMLRNGRLAELSTLSDRRIQWFWEAADGVIWIGHEDGLFHYRDGQVQQQSAPAIDRLDDPRFLCHHQQTTGSLWIGTSNGILRYRSGRYEAFPPDCGLLADNIERLTTDAVGNLWFGGRDGLFHVSIEELDAYAEGQLGRVTSYRVPGFDRFPPLPAFSQGCIVRDGELWIAAEPGLMKLAIQPFHGKRRLPTIRIEKVAVDGAGKSFAKPFEFQSGPSRLSVEYTVLTFDDQRHIRVAYQLEGHDREWVSAGADGTAQYETAQYTDLRPGSYRFRVKVQHGNEPWVEAEDTVSFSVLPRWWELIWLRVAIALATTAGVIGYVRHRLLKARQVNAELRREISDRVLAEEQSRQNQEQLARVSRAASMGELSTSIAHEVKQPLFAIVSNAQTARKLLDQEQPDVDEVRDALGDIASDGNRASTIIDRIRALVKKERQPADDLDINEVVVEAASFAEREIRRRQLNLHTELSSDLPLVTGDPIELQQVILNLLVNGAQAMQRGESRDITLRTCAIGGSVQVAVEDHGIGISDEQMQRIFEPFFTTKPIGIGMGLSINRTIIDAHGGRIWAERNEDQGMTFYFQIPANDQHAHSRSEHGYSAANPSNGD